MDKISKGTQILAMGGKWTVVSCGNGRYGLVGSNGIRHTMSCAELRAEFESKRAFLANPDAYSVPVISGAHYKRSMREFQKAISS